MPITKSGFEKLKKDLEVLKTVLLPANIKDIEVARAHGDLKENAEYHAAKERQSHIHGKIQEIENNLALSDVINLTAVSTDKVVFGATVCIEETESGAPTRYHLVGPFESDLSANKISVTAPLGKALIGKKIGDAIEVKTPGGLRNFEIVDILYNNDDLPA
jgi:transcription elongation factor GreA